MFLMGVSHHSGAVVSNPIRAIDKKNCGLVDVCGYLYRLEGLPSQDKDSIALWEARRREFYKAIPETEEVVTIDLLKRLVALKEADNLEILIGFDPEKKKIFGI